MPSSAIHILIITIFFIIIPPLKLIDIPFETSVKRALVLSINLLKFNEKLIVTQESNVIIKTQIEG
ncbi:MAG: hypothetical protein JEY71_11890 [Sphaerochaeta sp.]|nr:hypothetical protein [Sphaerochaeta sp.]